MNESIDIRWATNRFATELSWLKARHSFSFGSHFDPLNVSHGQLIVLNEDWISPGGGFGRHSHADMEIVTWVLQGALEHWDSKGNSGVLRPGLAQRMSAGSGITHSEMNASETEPVHLLQMWVVPDAVGLEPSYEDMDFSTKLATGELVAIASGQGHEGAMPIHQQGAVMWACLPVEGQQVRIPEAPFVHVFVARGVVELNGLTLKQGDAARLTQAGQQGLLCVEDSEVIFWESQESATG